jgi:UDP-N-acetylmuramoyl-L-alanyl-D-glutamate--2,6-diaminopimelate ligase
LAAAAVTHAMGIDGPSIARGVASLKGIPGRMESVENRRDLTILVDYAHKPEALEKALLSVRSLTPGRVIAVFGCGGERDRSKRPVMGSIAARLSDLAIVTSDNPRGEDPQTIIDAIVSGIEDRSNLIIEPDRTSAIRLGIKDLKPGDCLLIAGKGHETYQIIGSTKLPFDDKAVVQESLKELV